MYVWNINALKKHLAEQGLSEAHTFYYVLLYVGLSALCTELVAYVPTENPNGWDYLDSTLSVLLPIAGTVYAFLANRGAQGRNFAAKYFSIGFVMLIRFLVYLIPVPFVVFGYYAVRSAWGADAAGADDLAGTNAFEVLVGAALYVAYYLRVAKHIRDTAAA